MNDRTKEFALLRRGRLLLPVFCCCTLAAIASAARGQEVKKDPAAAGLADLPAPNLKMKFYEDFRGGDPNNPNLRFIRDANIRWEAEGARITMPAGQGKIPTTGIAANFRVKGDFQITASFDILNAEQPTEGYGVGVSIYVAIDPDAGDAVSLARRVGVKGGTHFLSDRMKPNPAKAAPDHYVKVKLSKATNGKLRIQRVGAMVRFLIADGDSPDFVPIMQDNKKRLETEFGAGDIRYFQVGGDAGLSEAALDLRLLEFTVEAEELPGIIERPKRAAPEPVVNWPGANAQAAAAPSRLGMIGILGASAFLLLVFGVGAWILLRRRRRAKTPPIPPAKVEKPAAESTAASFSFACTECGRKLRAKVEAAGKKLKCPQCRSVTLVPEADAFEANRDLS